MSYHHCFGHKHLAEMPCWCWDSPPWTSPPPFPPVPAGRKSHVQPTHEEWGHAPLTHSIYLSCWAFFCLEDLPSSPLLVYLFSCLHHCGLKDAGFIYYSSILIYLFSCSNCSFSRGGLFSLLLLPSHAHVSALLVWVTSLLPGTTRWSRLILYIFAPVLDLAIASRSPSSFY